jgi:hypothetical protein
MATDNSQADKKLAMGVVADEGWEEKRSGGEEAGQRKVAKEQVAGTMTEMKEKDTDQQSRTEDDSSPDRPGDELSETPVVSSPVSVKAASNNRGLKIIIGLLSVMLVGLMGMMGWLMTRPTGTQVANPSPTLEPEAEPTLAAVTIEEATPEPMEMVIVENGFEWVQPPRVYAPTFEWLGRGKSVNGAMMVNDGHGNYVTEDFIEGRVTYRQIATLADGGAVVHAQQAIERGGSLGDTDYFDELGHRNYLLTVDQNGQVKLLSKYYYAMESDTAENRAIMGLAEQIGFSDQVIPQISPTQPVSYQQQNFISVDSGKSHFDYRPKSSLSSLQLEQALLTTTPAGDLYQFFYPTNTASETWHRERAFSIITPDDQIHPYLLISSQVLDDGGRPKATWQDMTFADQTFSKTVLGGCGMLEATSTKESILPD